MPARLSLLVLALVASVSARAFAGEAKPHIDDKALRYYASIGHKDRVAAETRRLTALDPTWRVPDDLYTARPGRDDEGPLWQLFKQDRLDEIAKAIAMRQAVEPDWKPSEDLVAKIEGRKLRADIMKRAKAGEWHAVVQGFKGKGFAWAKDDAEALWTIAEAYARENDCGEAYIVYRSILTDHPNPDERRATIEFAIPLIPMSLTEKLIAMGHVDASGKSEFAPIAIDITRARISAFLHDEPANEVSDSELKAFEDFVRDETNPDEPGLVAWYDYKRQAYAEALDWFKLAITKGGDAMVAHGLAHTLRRLDRRREAEEVAYAWREPLVNNSILFIDLLETDLTKERPPLVEPERLARYAQVTIETESGEGAQALAWYAYNTCQYPTALHWFERANAWLPKEATVYGYALALQRLHRAKEFRDVVNRYDGLFPKVVALAFDDGIRKPSPCEANAAAPVVLPAGGELAGIEGADWQGRTMADTVRPDAWHPREKSARYVRALVPSPETIAGGAAANAPMKKTIEFPVSVSPENHLRFSALSSVATGEGRDPVGGWPLVARRVPGVGSMPYERWGFALLPGYDGSKEPSTPTAMDRAPPAGSLWAFEQSLRDTSYHRPSADASGALTRPSTLSQKSEPSQKPGRS